MQDVSTVLLVSTVVLITRRRARGVDEVFIPVWFRARPIKTGELDEIDTRAGEVRWRPERTSPKLYTLLWGTVVQAGANVTLEE